MTAIQAPCAKVPVADDKNLFHSLRRFIHLEFEEVPGQVCLLKLYAFEPLSFMSRIAEPLSFK